MGNASSSRNKFFDNKKISIVKTRLKSKAEYVTPQRIGGRVAPTKSTSAVSPRLKSFMIHLHPKHSADPGDDLRRPKRNCDPQDRRDTPPPGNAIRHGHSAQHHDENDCNGGEPSEDVRLQRGGPRHERRGLRERKLGDQKKHCEGTSPRPSRGLWAPCHRN